MKPWLFRILLVSFLGSQAGCAGNPAQAPIYLGHVATLSGPDKQAGEMASQGIRLALEEANKDTAQRPILVRHTDTQGKLDAFESQAVRLAAVNRVAAILGGTTPEEVIRLDKARSPGTPGEPSPLYLPIVSPCSWWMPAMSDQVFLLGMSPKSEGKILGRFAAENLQASKLVILVNDQSEQNRILSETCAQEFTEALKKKSSKAEGGGANVVHFSSSSLGEVGKEGNGPEVIARLERENPQAILLVGNKSDLRMLLGKLKQPRPAILYGGEEGSLRPADLETGETVFLASAFTPTFPCKEGENPSSLEKFAQQFRDTFKKDPDVQAALAFEGTKWLVENLRRNPDAFRFREDLRKTKDFPGVAGPLTLAGQQQFRRSLFILRMDRQQTVYQAKYEP